MTMDDLDAVLRSSEGREATFRAKHEVSNGSGVTAVYWPHTTPTARDLANAGFYYKPRHDSIDNCVCFRCGVKLDEWAADDSPAHEHYQHRPECSWARIVMLHGNPSDPDMLAARIESFGDSWPHENKSGWKCKTHAMAAAGWVFDPSLESPDAVRCFYCNMGIDSFEKQDDPYQEHHGRAPNCDFFRLSMQSLTTAEKPKKGRAKTTKRASKASRLSTQSMQSTFSEAPSFMSLGDTSVIDQSVDENSTLAKPKGRKPAAKRAPRAKKGAREASVEPSMMDASVNITSINTDSKPAKVTYAAEPSIIPEDPFTEITNMSQVADDTKKSAKTRKPRAAAKPKAKVVAMEDQPDELTSRALKSPSMHSALEDRQTSPSTKRGMKRTSAGVEKTLDVSESESASTGRPQRNTKLTEKAAMGAAAAAPPPPQSAKTRTRKAKNDGEDQTLNDDLTELKPAPKTTRSKKAKTANDTSQVEAVEISRVQVDELPRLAESQAVKTSQIDTPRVEPNIADEGPNIELVGSPSPQTSDAENRPPGSSTRKAGQTLKPQQVRSQSPIKEPLSTAQAGSRTTRVPLAASTPKQSPQQKSGRLVSTVGWVPTDLDTALLTTDEGGPEDSNIEERLLEVGGSLSSPEKRMTLEEWIRSRAAAAEESLRQKCERMVATFEREGARAMQVIESIEVKAA